MCWISGGIVRTPGEREEAQQSHDNKFSLCLIKIKIALVKYIISNST